MFARREDGALEMLFNGTFSAFCTPHVMVQGCIGPVSALVKIKINKRKRSWIGTNDELADVRVYAFDEYCGILRDHQSTLKSFAARATVLFTILLSIQVEHREIRLRCTTVARRWGRVERVARNYRWFRSRSMRGVDGTSGNVSNRKRRGV